jgi:glycosyltransferase involved in cell wall biosynthesis
MPEVSIITSTYRRTYELERAIKSVQAQTFKDWEHIVVYDGPADQATKEMVAKYPHVKLIETEKNHGNHTKPKNVGILASKGKYICYLDDDCEYLPNFIDVLKLELELGGYDVVYGDERIFKTEEDRVGEEAISMEFNGQFLLNRSFIDTNVAFHTREAVFSIGGWDETLPRFADWNLFVRMAKSGKKFKHIPIFVTRYYVSEDNSAKKTPTRSWVDEETGITMFEPVGWNPSSCYIYGPWLGNDREEEKNPKVAIFTVTYDRLEYTKRMHESMKSSTEYHFDWFVFDNGSTDGTQWRLPEMTKWYGLSKENKGLTYASNACIDQILSTRYWKENTTMFVPNHDVYQIVGKVDNDCLFLTQGWLEDFIDLWKRNHQLYMGPYPEGLVDHPGGAFRVASATIGDEYVEVVKHLSGICAFIDAKAYRNFRWKDQFLHGQQDGEATQAFMNQGYMPLILPRHRIMHMDTTAGQKDKYPEYFERRKKEKTTTLERDYNEIQNEESAFSDKTVWGERVVDSIQRYKDHFTGKVLDAGCNDGTAMEAIKSLPGVTKVVGVDISPEKVKRATERNLEAVEGVLESLPFKDKEFDVVFCSHTFEHAADGKKAAQELMRVAKKYIVIVPLEEQTENPAHTNHISSHEKLKEFFNKIEFEEELNRLEKEYVIIGV